MEIKRRVKGIVIVAFLCFANHLLYTQTYIITNIAGQRTFGYSGDEGPATNAHLGNPTAVYPDNYGNIYISDWGNSRLRMVSRSGVISTIAGNGIYGFSGDGGMATAAELNGPMGIFADISRNIYVADIGNERIRKIDSNGNLTTIGGNGSYGFSGDGGPAVSAEFEDPAGISGDGTGNIFIADEFNNRVREITINGIISTIAGCGVRGYSGDGGAATMAELYYPAGVAIDNSGNIYIADENNNCVRKVNSDGIISTVAGNGIAGYTGDGGSSTLSELFNPASVGVDKKGNIYIADGFNSRIRKIGTDGIISTIAGNGIAGYSGIGGPATLAMIYNPVSIVPDTSGNIYFANEFNNFVQKLSPSSEVKNLPSVMVYPNPSQGIFTIQIHNFQSELRLEVYNILGERVSFLELENEQTELNFSSYSKGVYIYKVLSGINETFASGKIVII